MRTISRAAALIVILLSSAGIASAQGTITGLTLSPASVEAGATVTATATGSSEPCGAVHIDWGDGAAITYATERLPVTQTHVYKASGTFSVRAQGMGNCVGEARSSVTVRPPAPPPAEPRLTAILLPTLPEEPQPRTPIDIRIEGTGNCRLTLEFGDGNSQVIHGVLPTIVRHAYALPGRYTIVATPDPPCAERRVATVEFSPRRQRQAISAIEIDTPAGGPPSMRSIKVLGSGQCGYTLDFGDGNSETRNAPLPDAVRHNYPREGRYTVVATAAAPCSGTIRQTFTVGPDPGGGADPRGSIAKVEVQPLATGVGQPVTITVQGTGTCKFVVDFDDGESRTLTERLPYRLTYRYAAAGSYDIVVWAYEPCTGEGDALVRIRRQ